MAGFEQTQFTHPTKCLTFRFSRKLIPTLWNRSKYPGIDKYRYHIPFRGILAVWKRRDMPLYGRATVLNTFALSKVYYAAHIPTILPYHLGQLEADIWNFLWRDKNHLVRKTVCIAPVTSGGLTVPDLRSRLTAIRFTPAVAYIVWAWLRLPQKTGLHRHGF